MSVSVKGRKIDGRIVCTVSSLLSVGALNLLLKLLEDFFPSLTVSLTVDPRASYPSIVQSKYLEA